MKIHTDRSLLLIARFEARTGQTMEDTHPELMKAFWDSVDNKNKSGLLKVYADLCKIVDVTY